MKTSTIASPQASSQPVAPQPLAKPNVKTRLLASSLFKSFRNSELYDINLLRFRIIPFAPVEGIKYFVFAQKTRDPSDAFKNSYKEALEELAKLSLNDFYTKLVLNNEMNEVIRENYQKYWPIWSTFFGVLPNCPIFALNFAIEEDRLEAVRWLISYFKGENKDHALGTSLRFAASKGNLPIVRIFLDFIDMISPNDLMGAFDRAAENGRLEVVRALIPFANRFPDHCNFAWGFKEAALYGHIEVLQLLLENREIFLNFERAYEEALSQAILRRNTPVLETLLSVPLEINPDDSRNERLLRLVEACKKSLSHFSYKRGC